jgi:hypothetical protein
MPSCSSRTFVVSVLVLAALCSSFSVARGQTTRTLTSTQTLIVTTTNSYTTTVTSPAIIYTTSTEAVNSTSGGTVTTTQSYFTAITVTSTTALSGMVTATTTYTLTSVTAQTMQLLASTWGELLTLLLVVLAIAGLLASRLRGRRPRGVVCSKCGTQNPPFAEQYCVKCGNLLKES